MWTVVYMAPNKDIIERLQKELENHDILVKVRRVGDDDINSSYELMVTESEVEQSHNIVIDAGF